MKTSAYNPSAIEIAIAKSIASLKDEIAAKMKNIKVESVKEDLNADNPILRFRLVDKDKDRHEVAIRIIQKPDNLLSNYPAS